MTKHTLPLTCNQLQWVVIIITAMLIGIGAVNHANIALFIMMMVSIIIFGILFIIRVTGYIEDNWQCRCDE